MGNDTNNKRYYWLKLEKNFFKDARIKKLRRLAGGDTYTIIYLKLMLLSLELEGKLVYEGIYPTFEEEMADKIDEYDKHLDDVRIAISWLQSEQILLPLDDGDFQFKHLLIGSETKNNVYKKQKRLEKFQSDSNQIPIILDNRDKSIDKEKDIDIRDNNILSQILGYWNEKSKQYRTEQFKMPCHKAITPNLEKALNKALSLYGYNDITLAIEHYAIVCNDSNYYFNYVWSLEDFVKQSNALPDFLDKGEKWINYCSSKSAKVKRANDILNQIDMEEMKNEGWI